jgi:sugar phosphate isomerase/epimerase
MSSRRHFIKQTTFGSTALLLPDFLRSSKTMPIGLQLYTLRNEMNKDPKGMIEKVAALGYSTVETFGYNQGKWFGLTANEFSALLKSNGLSSPSGHTFPGGMFLSAGWEDKWKTAVEDAHTLGQQYIVIPWLEEPHRKSLDNYKKIAAGLGTAARVAQSAGLELAYHNHDFEFVPLDGQTGMDILLKETDAGLVKIELDLYWATKAGHDPIELFTQHPGRFSLWHVKDMDNTEKKFFTEVGNGVIDFKAIFAKAKQSGMKYFFVEQDVCPGSPIDSISKSIDYLKKNIVR